MSGYTNVTVLPLDEQAAIVLERLHGLTDRGIRGAAVDLLLDKLSMIREAEALNAAT